MSDFKAKMHQIRFRRRFGFWHAVVSNVDISCTGNRQRKVPPTVYKGTVHSKMHYACIAPLCRHNRRVVGLETSGRWQNAEKICGTIVRGWVWREKDCGGKLKHARQERKIVLVRGLYWAPLGWLLTILKKLFLSVFQKNSPYSFS